MAFKLAEAFVQLNTRGLSQVNRDFDRTTDKFKSVSGAVSGLQPKLTGLTKAVGALGVGFAAVKLLSFGKDAVRAAADMQKLTLALRSVAGDSVTTARQLARLRDVAKLPGLGLQEAVRASVSLQAAGFEARQAERAIVGFGNALATVGKGRADLDGVILALTQIASKGKISAEEINQIAERVPQIRRILIEAFGTASSEALQKLGVSATDFVAKVTTELEKLPRVAGGISNEFENLNDEFFELKSTLGDIVLPEVATATSALSGIVGFLNDAAKGLRTAANEMRGVRQELEFLEDPGAIGRRALAEAAELQAAERERLRPEDSTRTIRIPAPFLGVEDIRPLLPGQQAPTIPQRGLVGIRERGIEGVDFEGTQLQVQNLNEDVEFNNALIQHSIELFNFWAETIGETANAFERLEKFKEILAEQGIAVVDNVVLAQEYSEGWKDATLKITRLQRDIRTQNEQLTTSAKQVGNAFLRGLGGITTGFKATGQSIKDVASAVVENTSESNEAFRRLQEGLVEDADRAEISILSNLGQTIEARKRLLALETQRRIAEIKRQGLTATQQEQAITEVLRRESAIRLQISRDEAAERAKFTGLIADIQRGQARQTGTQTAFQISPEQTEVKPPSFTDAINQSLKREAKNIERSFKVITDTVEGAKVGGAVGAVSAALISLATETEGFQRIIDGIGGVIGEAATAISPLTDTIADALQPAFRALGDTLQSLSPLFELLAVQLRVVLKPLEIFGNILQRIADGLGGFLGAIKKLVLDIIPGEQAGERREAPRRGAPRLLGQRRRRGEMTREPERPRQPFDLTPFQRNLDELLGETIVRVGGGRVSGKIARDPAVRGRIEVPDAEERRERATGGISISAITGPTRDILVSALSPLNQLDTTFPSMLDELRLIRKALTGQAISIPEATSQEISRSVTAVTNQAVNTAQNAVNAQNQNVVNREIQNINAAPAIANVNQQNQNAVNQEINRIANNPNTVRTTANAVSNNLQSEINRNINSSFSSSAFNTPNAPVTVDSMIVNRVIIPEMRNGNVPAFAMNGLNPIQMPDISQFLSAMNVQNPDIENITNRTTTEEMIERLVGNGGNEIIVSGDINISVANPQELSTDVVIDEINRQLRQELRRDGRRQGGNRRTARI